MLQPCCALALGLALVAAAPAGAEPVLDPEQVPWRHLVLRDDGWLADATTEIAVHSLPGADAERELASGDGALPAPAAGPVVVVDVDIRADAPRVLGGPTAFRGRSWLVPESGQALQRVRDKLAGDRYRKTYRYGDAGVVRRRAEPENDDQAEGDASTWPEPEPRRDLPYPPDRAGCDSVSDPSALLLLASSARLRPGDEPLTVCVFNKKHIHRVEITPVEREALDVAYEVEGSESRAVRESVNAVRLAIHSKPVVFGELDAEPLELLGLEGDMELFVDERSGLPVRIRGRAGDAGDVDFRLSAAGLAGSPPAVAAPSPAPPR